MEGAFGRPRAAGEVVAVVRELLARGQGGGLADDAVAFEDLDLAVRRADDPFPAQQLDRLLGEVADGEEVDEGVRGFRGEVRIPVVGHLVDGDPEAWEFLSGGLHVSQDKRA